MENTEKKDWNYIVRKTIRDFEDSIEFAKQNDIPVNYTESTLEHSSGEYLVRIIVEPTKKEQE